MEIIWFVLSSSKIKKKIRFAKTMKLNKCYLCNKTHTAQRNEKKKDKQKKQEKKQQAKKNVKINLN